MTDTRNDILTWLEKSRILQEPSVSVAEETLPRPVDDIAAIHTTGKPKDVAATTLPLPPPKEKEWDSFVTDNNRDLSSMVSSGTWSNSCLKNHAAKEVNQSISSSEESFVRLRRGPRLPPIEEVSNQGQGFSKRETAKANEPRDKARHHVADGSTTGAKRASRMSDDIAAVSNAKRLSTTSVGKPPAVRNKSMSTNVTTEDLRNMDRPSHGPRPASGSEPHTQSSDNRYAVAPKSGEMVVTYKNLVNDDHEATLSDVANVEEPSIDVTPHDREQVETELKDPDSKPEESSLKPIYDKPELELPNIDRKIKDIIYQGRYDDVSVPPAPPDMTEKANTKRDLDEAQVNVLEVATTDKGRAEIFQVSEAVAAPVGTSSEEDFVRNAEMNRNQWDEHLRNDVFFRHEFYLYPVGLLLSVAIMVIILVALFPSGSSSGGRQFLELMANASERAARQSDACSASACSANAAFLEGLLSWEYGPCDDFYKFVCSRWTNQYATINQSTTGTVTFDDDYHAMIEDKMHALLLDENKRRTLLRPLRGLFGVCVDDKHLEASGLEPLLQLLASASLECFPYTPPVRKGVSVWKISAKVLKLVGAATFAKVEITEHPVTKSKDVISLNVPDTLSASYGGNINKTILAYYDMIYTAVKILKKDFVPPSYTMDVVNFAYEFERLFAQSAGKRKSTLHKPSDYPEFAMFLSEIFSDSYSTLFQNGGSNFILQRPDDMSSLLALVNMTELHTVMNFLGIRLILQASPFMPRTDLVDIYATLLYGKPMASVPRWKLCVRVVEKTFQPIFLIATLLSFRVQNFTDEMFDFVKTIVDDVIVELPRAVLFSSKAETAVRYMILNTQYRLVGPPWVGRKDAVLRYLRRIPKVVKESGLVTYMLLHEHALSAILDQGSKGRWAPSFFAPDCWIDGNPRTVYVPALLFNLSMSTTAFEFIAFHLPRAGVRLGRCITRMVLEEFESVGISNEGSRNETNDSLECLSRQLGSEVPVTRLEDSIMTQVMYKRFVKMIQGIEYALTLRLPRGDDLSPGKQFFIYSMLQSCEKHSRSTTSFEGRVHPANVPFQNHPEFHKTFQCVPSTPMNPPMKCHLWKS